MSEFSELQDRLLHTDQTLWLGRLCWYGVTAEAMIQHVQMVQLLVQHKLSSWLPRVPGDGDAFRRACSKAERKRVFNGTQGQYDNYLVRKIGKGGRLVARIVRETVDASNEKVSFETEICKLTWVKDQPNIDVQCNGTDQVAASIAQEIVQTYLAERGMLNGYAIRELIRRILLSVNATNVRGSGGGLYFVNEEHGEVVESLERLALDLDKVTPGSVIVHTLPLIDDHKQREMLRRAYESEAVEDLERAIEEIIAIRHEGKDVSEATVAWYMEILSKAKAKDKEYTELLRTSLDSASSRIGILQRQVMELSVMVKV